MKEAEKFYIHLDEATGLLPSRVAPRIIDALESLILEARDALARAIDPATMTDIRQYKGERNAWNDEMLAGILIDCLVEKAHDDETTGMDLFDLAEEIGLKTVLSAPASKRHPN